FFVGRRHAQKLTPTSIRLGFAAQPSEQLDILRKHRLQMAHLGEIDPAQFRILVLKQLGRSLVERLHSPPMNARRPVTRVSQPDPALLRELAGQSLRALHAPRTPPPIRRVLAVHKWRATRPDAALGGAALAEQESAVSLDHRRANQLFCAVTIQASTHLEPARLVYKNRTRGYGFSRPEPGADRDS